MTEPQRSIQFEDFAKMDIHRNNLEAENESKQAFNFESRHRN
jgi:hypothetical protein